MNHVTVNNIPSDQPLFSYRNDKGRLVCLSRRKFLQRCNNVWKKHGVPSITGHSFRIGGTTHLLIAGVNPDVVQAMGRWNSDVFLIYWRRLDILAPLHAEFLDL
jgi:site-specific recombinase XerD